VSSAVPSRAWEQALARLPALEGALVLDLGCGTGDGAAALAARGASVVGLDLDAARIELAGARRIPRATFRVADLRAPLQVERAVDGLWACYTAAFFTDLSATLERWARALRPGGWMALVEVDDFLGHEPLDPRWRELFAAYAAEALAAGRYDFHTGSKFERAAAGAGLELAWIRDLRDPEFAWDGPLGPDALASWRARWERMPLLRAAAGADAQRVRDDFLACLASPDHRSSARVRACLARKPR
jgi:SAM-dependent methyltransferase